MRTTKNEHGQEQTALTKTQPLTGIQPLTSIEALEKTWHELRDKANLVSPVASVDTIPAMHGISLRSVVIDPSTNNFGQGPEVYRDARFCEKDERALGGVGLQKIAAAAGVQFLNRQRLDDRSDPHYCEIEVTLGIRDYDGTWRQVTKAREVDLRDGAAESMKPEKVKGPGDKYAQKTGRMVPLDASALADRRRHIQSLAETKAFHRALRTLLQLRQKYTLRELEKPFVVPKLIPALDPTDPEQKAALIDMAVGRETGLFGERNVDAPRELKDVTPAPATSSAPAASPPPHVDVDESNSREEDFDAADFEVLDFPKEETPPEAVCVCPCGCQIELTEKVAEIGIDRLGTPRCRECYPSRSFSIEKHKGVGDLGIPKMEGLTGEQVIAGLEGGAQ